jgi:BlaI family penicillinase repressor
VSKSAPKPTDAELDILRVLWTRGPSTVREVHEALGEDVRYTTTLKQLQVMLDKGLVRRDERQRSHVYEAAVDEEETQHRLLDNLLAHAFGGSRSKLLMRAVSGGKASEEELRQIRALLDELEGAR